MTEAILALSQENIFSSYFSYKGRSTLHLLLQLAAVGFSTAGFAIVIINKNNAGKQHFKTLHAIFGLVSMILFGISVIIGLPAYFPSKIVRAVLPPKVVKFCHIIFGIFTVIFGTVTLVLSLYTHWFTERANETAQITCIIVVVVISFWILLRPAQSAFRWGKSLMD